MIAPLQQNYDPNGPLDFTSAWPWVECILQQQISDRPSSCYWQGGGCNLQKKPGQRLRSPQWQLEWLAAWAAQEAQGKRRTPAGYVPAQDLPHTRLPRLPGWLSGSEVVWSANPDVTQRAASSFSKVHCMAQADLWLCHLGWYFSIWQQP